MSPTALILGTSEIRQHDGMYSLNDLHRAAGGEDRHTPNRFIRLDQTRALISQISQTPEMASAGIPAFTVRNGGKFRGTYVCRELVIAYAAWISPAFHLQVIRVFLDQVAPLALPAPDTLTRDQEAHLIRLLTQQYQSEDIPYALNRLHKHFGIQTLRAMPGRRYGEAGEYISMMRPVPVKALPAKIMRPPAWNRPRDYGAPRDNDYGSPHGLPRTSRVAEKLISCIKVWGQDELPKNVSSELSKLCEDIRGLLVTGDTEIQEALIHISIAEKYLRRWSGTA
jgi:hypothetical protein